MAVTGDFNSPLVTFFGSAGYSAQLLSMKGNPSTSGCCGWSNPSPPACFAAVLDANLQPLWGVASTSSIGSGLSFSDHASGADCAAL